MERSKSKKSKKNTKNKSKSIASKKLTGYTFFAKLEREKALNRNGPKLKFETIADLWGKCTEVQKNEYKKLC